MREPAVAGMFYRRGRELLTEQVRSCFTHRLGPGRVPVLAAPGPRRIKGAVFPHAGYEYSGPVAAHSASALAEDGFPESFLIIGPNHRGWGEDLAVGTEAFSMPMGRVAVDAPLARALIGGEVVEDLAAHMEEHSIEVQLPFLQFFKQDIRFVPVCMGRQDWGAARLLGERAARARAGRDVVVIASTDFTHCGPGYMHPPPRGTSAGEFAAREDRKAIERILALDPEGLIETVKRGNITMCGYGCVAAMLVAAKEMGAREARLLKYATSADVSGDEDTAVGYGAIIVF
ncbi:MAG: AmmeMemoRadiSam system protein B [Thermoplasmatota archaeon]